MPENREELLRQLREEARLVQEINENTGGYIEFVKKIKAIKTNIAYLENQISKATGEQKEILEEELRKVKELEVRYKRIKNETSSIVKAQEFSVSSLQTSKNLLGGITNIYSNIVSFTRSITEIDKKIKMSALSMGILDTQTKSFRKSLADAGAITNDFGIGQGQLAEMQGLYSQELGRTVMLGKDGLVAIGAMAAATGLGAEGAAKMASDFELIGYSAERTSEFIDQTMNDSSKMGLNSSKVVKAISSNIKLLNKYNFKGGVAGLKKMAETTTRLGVDMNFATSMAEKLFDIEGAVKMSAELQVLGGSFSNLADPFHLMYMARNDVAGLTEEIGKAVEQSVQFNNKTGEFDMSGLELHRLRKIAEQTGIAFEDLVTAGKNAKKFSMIEGQVSFNIGDDEKEFLMNTAQLDEKGKAYIIVDGEKKFLNMLGQSGKDFIKKQIEEKKSLAERAKSAQTFDEKITNFINKVKELFLPLMPVLDEFATTLVNNLKPAFDKFKATLESKEFKEGLKKFTEGAIWIGEKIGKLVSWFIENPMLGLGALALFETAKWFAMGISFGAGFNSVTKGIGNIGAGAGTFGKFGSVKGGMGLGSSLGKGLKTGAGLGLISVGANIGRSMLDNPDSDFGKVLGVGGQAAEYAAYGAMLGSVIPGIGNVAGGVIGGVAGLGKGIYDEYYKVDDAIITDTDSNDNNINKPSNSAKQVIFNPNDKIKQIDNKTMIAGVNKGGIEKAAKYLNNDSNNNVDSTVTHKFDELKISGDITISLPGGDKITTELIKDRRFIKNITKIINIQLDETKNSMKT